MTIRRRITQSELLLGLLCRHPVFFPLFFWHDELTQTPSIAQRNMMADRSRLQIKCTGRKVWKTGLIEARFIQYAITNSPAHGEREGLFCTPNDNHLRPVMERIDRRVERVPLFRMLKRSYNRHTGMYQFHTGFTWHCRIEGNSGTGVNMIGLRVWHILADEMAYGNSGAHRERIQAARPGCTWDLNGVPNGVRGTPFYRIAATADGAGWSKHRLTSYDNPMYQPQEIHRPQLIAMYGSENDPDYQRQVLAEWGSEAQGAFQREAMTFQPDLPYLIDTLTQTNIRDIKTGNRPDLLLPRPSGAIRYTFGIDVGFGGEDPYVIKIAYQLPDGAWYDLARITLLRVAQAYWSAWLIAHLIQHLNAPTVRVCIDTAGYGKAVVDKFIGPDQHDELAGIADWQNLIVSADAGGRVEIPHPTQPGITQSIGKKYYYTIELKKLMATGRLVKPGIVRRDAYGHPIPGTLVEPLDAEEIDEMLTTIEQKTSSGHVIYIPQIRGREHNTDANRYLTRAILDAEVGEAEAATIAAIGWTPRSHTPLPSVYHYSQPENWKAPWSQVISTV